MYRYAEFQINECKSKIYLNNNCKYKKQLLDILQVAEGNLPIKYSGLPLSINQIKDKECSVLIDKITLQEMRSDTDITCRRLSNTPHTDVGMVSETLVHIRT